MTASSGRSRLAWRFAHVLMTLAFGSALGACFNAPSDAVLFACDAKAAPTCPDGYSCAADDCCHRDGSDIEANLGSCRIGGAMSATADTTAGGPTSTSSASTSAASTSADAGASSSADPSSDSGATT